VEDELPEDVELLGGLGQFEGDIDIGDGSGAVEFEDGGGLSGFDGQLFFEALLARGCQGSEGRLQPAAITQARTTSST